MNASRRLRLLACLAAALAAAPALAERVLVETSIDIDGQPRRYFRLHDDADRGRAVPILLINGSGCADFGHRVPGFFKSYPAPVDVYFLEKPGVGRFDDGARCAPAYEAADTLDRRVADALAFLDAEPHLKPLGRRSVAVLGFSEGGTVAPRVAARSPKIGWLAVAGSGGLPQSEEFLIFAARGVAPYATLFSREAFLRTYDAVRRDPDSLDKTFFGHPYRYWSSHLFDDPLAAYAQLDIPIVAAMGERDDSVPIESGHRLRDALAARPGKAFTFLEYPEAGHALRAPAHDYLPDFIAGLARWLKGEPAPFR